MTKTIKVSGLVHKELKVYIANNEKENMTDFAGFSIMKELQNRGHKFVTGATNKKKKIAS